MTAGRPPKWDDPDKLQETVDAYFRHCLDTIITVQHAHSKGITEVKTPTPPTMAGLSYHLGISRETLNNYHTETLTGMDDTTKRTFRDIITHARHRIEANNIEMGMVGAYEAKLNALNLASNYGYSTRQDVDITDKTPKMGDSELDARIKRLMDARKG